MKYLDRAKCMALLVACGLLAGCAGRAADAVDGYEQIDPDVVISRDEVEEALENDDLSFAQSVPYRERDKEAPAGEAGTSPETEEPEEDAGQEEFLPGYETERDWRTRNTGSASYVWKPTVVVSLFIDEEEDLWTEEEREYALNLCNVGFSFLRDELSDKYDVDCNLIYDWSEDPDLRKDIRLYESISPYVMLKEEIHINELADDWMNEVPYRDLMLKYDTDSIAFLILVPHEGCSYSEMHCLEDGESTWNETSILYLQDMYSPDYAYETPTVYAHELLHLFGAEDMYSSAGIYSDETYEALASLCADDLMFRTFTKVNGVYTTFPNEVYGEISPVTAYLLGVTGEEAIEEVPELKRDEAGCFPGSSQERAFEE